MPLHRPFESDTYASVMGDTSLEYRNPDVLMPDAVTDGVAYIAADLANQRYADKQVRALELGVGAAPFLSLFAQRIRPTTIVDLHGADISEQVLPYAVYNVGRVLQARQNPADAANIRVEEWSHTLSGDGHYDIIYFNPPYLAHTSVIRDDFRGMPWTSLFVHGKDSLVHYRNVVPRLGRIVNPGGFAFIRTPRDETEYKKVLEIVSRVFENSDATIHHITTQTELGERQGKGLVIEFAAVQPTEFSVEPVRAIGLALAKRTLAA